MGQHFGSAAASSRGSTTTGKAVASCAPPARNG